jgi:hypothetical protein
MIVSAMQDIQLQNYFYVSLNSGYKEKRMGHHVYFILFTTVAPANDGLMDEMFH